MGSKESAIMSKTVGGQLTFRVHHDLDAHSPRLDEPMTQIVGWHRKYRVSDSDMVNFRDRDSFLESVRPEDIVRPLYMYEHGGVALATTPFSDKFDSGHLGYVLVTPERLEAIGIGQGETEVIEHNITTEIKELAAYMNGEVYQIAVHRMVDGDVLETSVATIGDIWETDDDTLDYAVDVVLGDVNDDYIGDVTMEMVKAADWE